MKGIDFDAETFQKSEVLEYLDEWMANPPAGFEETNRFMMFNQILTD